MACEWQRGEDGIKKAESGREREKEKRIAMKKKRERENN